MVRRRVVESLGVIFLMAVLTGLAANGCATVRPGPGTTTEQAAARALEAKRIADGSRRISEVLNSAHAVEVSAYQFWSARLVADGARLRMVSLDAPTPEEREQAAAQLLTTLDELARWRHAHAQVQTAVQTYVDKTRAALEVLRSTVAAGEDGAAARGALVAAAQTELPAAIELIPNEPARVALRAVLAGVPLIIGLL